MLFRMRLQVDWPDGRRSKPWKVEINDVDVFDRDSAVAVAKRFIDRYNTLRPLDAPKRLLSVKFLGDAQGHEWREIDAPAKDSRGCGYYVCVCTRCGVRGRRELITGHVWKDHIKAAWVPARCAPKLIRPRAVKR